MSYNFREIKNIKNIGINITHLYMYRILEK